MKFISYKSHPFFSCKNSRKKEKRNRLLSKVGILAFMRSTCFIFAMLLSLSAAIAFCSKNVYAADGTDVTAQQGITIQVLDVGQGLCVLIDCNGHSMLYDGGNGDSSSYVVAYLQKYGYDHFDYMFASHYDEDHISGLIGCLVKYTFGKVVCPNYMVDSEIYQSFHRHLQNAGAEVIHPVRGEQFDLGGAVITVLGPAVYSDEEDNNNSLAIRVAYGNFSVILTGDAEQEEENEILSSGAELKSDLYVVGHHGSSGSSSDALVAAVGPSAAIISCGLGNNYGHPTIETMRTLEKYQADIYRTDKQGEIICTSDGENYTFNVEPCQDHSEGRGPEDLENGNGTDQAQPTAGAGENANQTQTSADGATDMEQAQANVDSNVDENAQSADNAATTSDSTAQTYIINTNTGKFHYPDCRSVTQMKDSNKKEVEATREELIAEGYSPCGNCHP